MSRDLFTHGEIEGWPPNPRETWVVHGAMASGMATFNDDGAGERVVLLRVASTRNHASTEDDRTFVLRQDAAAEVVAAMLFATGQAFDRAAFLALIGDALKGPGL